jgi:hypothetical protein
MDREYIYNDSNWTTEKLNDIFIKRKPYNSLGESIVDFSNCGAQQKISINYPVVIIESNSSVSQIQTIINLITNPTRIIFKPGVYLFDTSLIINKSNLILEGPLDQEVGKVIFRGLKGTDFDLIKIQGTRTIYNKTIYSIKDSFVPIGSKIINTNINSTSSLNLSIGMNIIITYEMNEQWVNTLGMDKITSSTGADASDTNWDAKSFIYNFERKIVSIDNNGTITLDFELTCSLDRTYGNFYIRTIKDNRISFVEINNITLESEFNESNFQMVTPLGSLGSLEPKEKEYFDENHPMTGINIENAKHIYISNIKSYGFNEIVHLDKTSKNCTISKCSYYRPSSVIEGEKRYSFNMNGQYNLCIDCYAERGRHSFAFAARNEGPNAFVNCKARITYAWSEPHHRYNLCGLYDNHDDNIAVENRLFFGSGHGWIGAYYVFWNPKGQVISQNTPIANNFVVGGKSRDNGNFYIKRVGYLFPSGNYINFGIEFPDTRQSLYYSQVANKVFN